MTLAYISALASVLFFLSLSRLQRLANAPRHLPNEIDWYTCAWFMGTASLTIKGWVI